MFSKESKEEKKEKSERGKKRPYQGKEEHEKHPKKIKISHGSSIFKDYENTNFRDRTLFNPKIRSSLSHIFQSIDSQYSKGLKLEEKQLKDFKDNLEELLNQFTDYYRKEREEDYTKEGAIERAKEIFSEFLQDLIYVVLHPREFNKLNIEDQIDFQKKLIALSLNHPLFLFPGSKGRIVIWSDPETNATTLMTLRRSGFKKELDQFFTYLEEKFNSEKILAILNHTDRAGISAFHGAAMDNKADMLLDLLLRAELLYGKNREGLIKFLINESTGNYTALLSSVEKNAFDTAKVLIYEAKRIYGEDKEGFLKFLTKSNIKKFSVLNTAAYTGNFNMLRLILTTAKHYFGENKQGYVDFLSHKTIFGSTPLHNVLERGDFACVELLLKEGIEAYKQVYKENYEKEFLKSFINTQTKTGFTPINSATIYWKQSDPERKEGYEKIINELAAYGANPDITNEKGFSARWNAPKFFPEEQFVDKREKSKRPPSPTAKYSANKKTSAMFSQTEKKEKKEKKPEGFEKDKSYKR